MWQAGGLSFFFGELSRDSICIISPVSGPLSEICSAISVAEIREGRIWHEPMFVLFEKRLVILALKRSRFLRRIYLLEKLQFGIENGFIVHSLQRIQSLPFLFQLFEQFFIRAAGNHGQIQVKRM